LYIAWLKVWLESRLAGGGTMTRDEELLRYYYDRVERANKDMAQRTPAERKRIDFDNGYWHERVILQRLLEKSGIPICYGAIDCLESPTTTCVTTQHTACRQHVYSCYLCVSMEDGSPTK
jgi:hypothetical protein